MKKYAIAGIINGIFRGLTGINLWLTITMGIAIYLLMFYIEEYKKLKGDIKNG